MNTPVIPPALNIVKNVELQDFCTLATPARAAFYLRATSVEDIVAAVQWANAQQLPLLPLGGGSNLLLVGDFSGLVVHLALQGIEMQSSSQQSTVLLRAAAGESWQTLVDFSLAKNLWGLENLNLIPGTVGAAPIQNIGAYGVEFEQRFVSLEAVSLASGELRKFSHSECRFGYRDSIFKQALRGQYLIVSVDLQLQRNGQAVLGYPALAQQLALQFPQQPHSEIDCVQVAAAVAVLRTQKLPDPSQIPNAGSFFHNPVVSAAKYAALVAEFAAIVGYPQADGQVKLAAGWLIEQCGLKGQLHDGVGMHSQQALVLVNPGRRPGCQVLEFAHSVAAQVAQKFAVELTIEPQIYPS